jgi:peptide deformylase
MPAAHGIGARQRVVRLVRHVNPIDEVVHGLKAATYQHEVDHLNGTIFVDRADPATFTTWTEFERHHRAPFIEQVQQLVARVGS